MLTSLLLALTPAGGFLAAVKSLWQATCALVRYLFDGVAQCFMHPTTFLVCLLFGVAGAWGAAGFAKHKIAEARQELVDLKTSWKRKDADDERLARLADQAGQIAERDAFERGKRQAAIDAEAKAAAERESAGAPAAAPPAAGVPTVRRAAGSARSAKCQSGVLSSLPAILGGC